MKALQWLAGGCWHSMFCVRVFWEPVVFYDYFPGPAEEKLAVLERLCYPLDFFGRLHHAKFFSNEAICGKIPQLSAL
jgi:hypothetical protein